MSKSQLERAAAMAGGVVLTSYALPMIGGPSSAPQNMAVLGIAAGVDYAVGGMLREQFNKYPSVAAYAGSLSAGVSAAGVAYFGLQNLRTQQLIMMGAAGAGSNLLASKIFGYEDAYFSKATAKAK